MNPQENTPSIIKSINDLVTALSEGERTTYKDIVHSVDIPIDDFKEFASWSDECYTRNCIVKNEKFELILLCWKAGQITPIHDHGNEECWVTIIDGEFKEVIYQLDENNEMAFVKSGIANTKDITYMVDSMGFHSLENTSSENSMSLHLYAKPIPSCNSYNAELGKLVKKDLVYTTVSESIEN